MNDLYRSIVIGNIKRILNETSIADNFNHMVLRGRAREIVVKNFLRPYLNPMIGICTGIVIDTFNHQSKQMDIIIFDQTIVPPSMLSEEEGIIPYESVLATIEVKTSMDRTSLKDAVINARTIKLLKSNFDNISGVQRNINSPACYAFSFTTDTFKEKSELKCLEEIDEELNKNNDFVNVPLSGVIILNKVFLYCVAANNKPPTFEEVKSKSNYELILEFLINIVNTCNVFYLQREIQFIDKYLK